MLITAGLPPPVLAPKLHRVLLRHTPLLQLPRGSLLGRAPSRSNRNARRKNPNRPSLPQHLQALRKFPATRPWLSRRPLACIPSLAKPSASQCPAPTPMQSSAIRALVALASWISVLVELLSNWNPTKKSPGAFLPSCTSPFFRPCAST